jgi:integrase/recombinase XerD
MARIGRPKGTGTGKARELTTAEVERLTATTQPRDRALVWLCLGAGLRVSEACTAKIGHLGSDGSVVIEKWSTKGKATRRCFISPVAITHIEAYLATRPDAGADEPLFPSRQGGHFSANWGVHLVDQLFTVAGIKGASSHSLRRTHANALNRVGVNVTIIQGQLGHKHLSTTAVYLNPSETERAQEVARVVTFGTAANDNDRGERKPAA